MIQAAETAAFPLPKISKRLDHPTSGESAGRTLLADRIVSGLVPVSRERELRVAQNYQIRAPNDGKSGEHCSATRLRTGEHPAVQPAISTVSYQCPVARGPWAAREGVKFPVPSPPVGGHVLGA